MGKGEIARYEQFLLFPQCFQKACFPGVSKGVIVWEWVKSLPNNILDLSNLKVLADDERNSNKKYKFGFNKEENIVGKGENAVDQIESTCILKKK